MRPNRAQTSMLHPRLISVDWGTTTLRCSLLAGDGSIIARRDGGPGIRTIPSLGFAAVLAGELSQWHASHGPLPCLMSGMIGSRQGWAEVPYLTCPAKASSLAQHLHRIETDFPCPIYIVPGLAIDNPNRPPEVMRGEETQILGALSSAQAPTAETARLFVLPGTHSKWVDTLGDTITDFTTYMTGEIFAALRHHTILGGLMPAEPAMYDAAAFSGGVTIGATKGHPGDLLNRVFSTRTLGLFNRIAPSALAPYLSGVLIGAEIAAAAPSGRGLTIVGNSMLSRLYEQAAEHLGMAASTAPPDCAARGHWLIALASGLVKTTTP